MALTKLSARLPAQFNDKIMKFLNSYKNNMNIELQQRATEFSEFFSYNDLRLDAMNRMPIPENLHQETHRKDIVPDISKERVFENMPKEESKPIQQPEKTDLLDILGLSSNPQPQQQTAQPSLLDLLSGIPVQPPQQTQQPTQTTQPFINDLITPIEPTQPQTQPVINDLITPIETKPIETKPIETKPIETQTNTSNIFAPTQPPTLPSEIVVKALESNGIIINFHVTQNGNVFNVLAKFSNSNAQTLENFVMKIAVPKWINLQLRTASSQQVGANTIDSVTQQMILTNNLLGEKPVVVKLKALYCMNGKNYEENANVFVCN